MRRGRPRHSSLHSVLQHAKTAACGPFIYQTLVSRKGESSTLYLVVCVFGVGFCVDITPFSGVLVGKF